MFDKTNDVMKNDNQLQVAINKSFVPFFPLSSAYQPSWDPAQSVRSCGTRTGTRTDKATVHLK